MRISDHRYARDRTRYDLAYQLLGLGARPKTVIAWTGLTEYQVRTLADDYQQPVIRHRGQSPRQLQWFWRNAQRQQQAAIFGGMCRELGVLSDKCVRLRREFSTPARAARLCRAYRAYVQCVRDPQVTFEHAVLLSWELSRGELVLLSNCSACNAIVLVDRLAKRSQTCGYCSGRITAARRTSRARLGEPSATAAMPATKNACRRQIRYQRVLF